jgi:NAD(P)-dependent dehydrogenase (short-subunit alcohol dehydrogenase family)
MPRTCLVTGANRGIGLEFVRQLLARGDHVLATCRQPGKATALNGLAGEHPGRLHVLPLDVADARSRAELVRELPLALGQDPRFDLVINNAGVLHSGERFGHVDAAILEDSLRTNAVGPFMLAQALVPMMRDAPTGGGGAGGAVNQASIGERLEGGGPHAPP